MSTWAETIALFAGKPYAWPDATCLAMLHHVISVELGEVSPYRERYEAAGSEAAMVRVSAREFGGVGAAHRALLGSVPGVREYHGLWPLGAPTRVAWCPRGKLWTACGMTTELSDVRGALIMRHPSDCTWYVWAEQGLVACSPVVDQVETSWYWRNG